MHLSCWDLLEYRGACLELEIIFSLFSETSLIVIGHSLPLVLNNLLLSSLGEAAATGGGGGGYGRFPGEMKDGQVKRSEI